MSMETFLNRFGGGPRKLVTVAERELPAPSKPSAPADAEQPKSGMSSFMERFGPRDEKKSTGFTSYEERGNAENERADMEAFIQKYGRVTEEYKFYGETITLRFDKEGHEYFRIEANPSAPDGADWIPVPGVTTLVGIKDKSFALMPWAANETVNYAKAVLAEMTPEEVARILTDEAIFRDWFVTTLEAAKKNYKDLSRKATDIGKAAHDWIERYINAQLLQDPLAREYEIEHVLGDLPEDPRAARCCEAAVGWMRAHNVRWVFTERKVYSKKYDAAGTCDGVCLIDSCDDPKCKGCDGRTFKDVLSAIDWKSSNALYDYYRWQVATYVSFLNEELGEWFLAQYGQKVSDYWVIQLGKDDGAFDMWYCPAEDFTMDFECFEACLILYKTSKDAAERLRDRRRARKAERKAAKEAALAEAKRVKAEAKEKLKADKLSMFDRLRADGFNIKTANDMVRKHFAAKEVDTAEETPTPELEPELVTV